jgi:thymidylate synthase
MENYLDLIKQILDHGVDKPDRTGVGSRYINGATLHWNLEEGFPSLTCRKVAFRIAFEETMFFLRGETDTKKLEEKNINIWKGNTTREFLDNVGLDYLNEGNMGKGYGYQWRNFGGNGDLNDGVDQVREMLEAMHNNPTSRRHIVTAWNPKQLHETPLPPCHLMHMYTCDTITNRLNSCFVMRSNDVPYGLPYNIMSYAFLNELFAAHLGMTSGQLTYFGWDAHIYQNQIEMCEELVERDSPVLPQLVIHKDVSTFEKMLQLEWSDVELVGYDPLPDFENKPGMAV